MERGTWAARGTEGALSTSQQACCVLPCQLLHLSVHEGRGRGFLPEACRTLPQPAPLSLCGLTRNQGVYTTVRGGGAESQPRVFKVKIGFSLPFHR